MKHYVYSPLPPTSYVIDALPRCETRTLMSVDLTPAAWNLNWLSNPGMDSLPGTGKDWWRVYKPLTGLARAVVADALNDDILHSKLLAPGE